MLSWAYETVPHQRPDQTGMTVEAHQFGYTALVPSVPLPPVNPPGPSMEAYPLQSELSQNHRVLHGHIFKEVIPPPQSGQGSRLMVTEVDQYGVERNRQAEFFFNGIVGHVRSYNGGRVNSWSEAIRLANYWRRHFNIPEVYMMKIPRGPHRGKIATDRMTVRTTPLEPMGKSQNPKWKTTLQ